MVHDPFYDLFPRRAAPLIETGKVALITIDMQFLDAYPDGWMGRVAKARDKLQVLDERFGAMDDIVPNIATLQETLRSAGQEVDAHPSQAPHRRSAGRSEGLHAGAGRPGYRTGSRDDEFLRRMGPVADRDRLLQDLGQRLQLYGDRKRSEEDEDGASGCDWPSHGRMPVAVLSRRLRSGILGHAGHRRTCASTRAAHEGCDPAMPDGGFIAAKTTEQVIGEVTAITPLGASV